MERSIRPSLPGKCVCLSISAPPTKAFCSNFVVSKPRWQHQCSAPPELIDLHVSAEWHFKWDDLPFIFTISGCIANTSSSVFLSRLQLKSVETVFPQWATTEELRTIHSQHRNDPWRKQVKIQHKRAVCLHLLVHMADSLFLLFSDEPDAKKVASQGEIDSALCTFNHSLILLQTLPRFSFQILNPFFFFLSQLLELSWRPCPNKGKTYFLFLLH